MHTRFVFLLLFWFEQHSMHAQMTCEKVCSCLAGSSFYAFNETERNWTYRNANNTPRSFSFHSQTDIPRRISRILLCGTNNFCEIMQSLTCSFSVICNGFEDKNVRLSSGIENGKSFQTKKNNFYSNNHSRFHSRNSWLFV